MSSLYVYGILLCLVGSAFFSGIETGIISIHRMRLRHFIKSGMPGAATLMDFLDNPDRLLGTALLGTNIFNVGASVLATSLAISLAGAWGEVSATIIMSVIIFIFGEYLPKAWFQSRPIGRCIRFAPLLQVSSILFRPFTIAMAHVADLLIPLQEADGPADVPFVTKDELKLLASESEQRGDLSEREREMIHEVFELSTKTAGQVMIPVERIVHVKTTSSVAELRAMAREQQVTWFPVFDEATETFTGMVNIFDVFSDPKVAATDNLSNYIRPILTVASTTPVDDILPLMRKMHRPVYLVTGDDSRTVGLITIDEIVEQIVGEF